MARATSSTAAVERVSASAFTIPTDRPESDGTIAWTSTTLVIVDVESSGRHGIGYSYAAAAAARVVDDVLRDAIAGFDAMDVRRAWDAMRHAVRNIGRPGIASHAIAAVDTALWDLKARLLDLPLTAVLGRARDDVPVYGSGGFTSYSQEEIDEQLSGWVRLGISSVKMKVGRHPGHDATRVHAARQAIGPDAELFVDANGAYDRKQALRHAEIFAADGVSWFEEPVSSDDLEGLRLVRDRAPAGMAIAAGEYGYDLAYFWRMLQSGAVDVLQADATRCGGLTGFLQVAAVCEAFGVPLSAHTAPALHLAACCATPIVRHLEYFHDHVRIEQRVFDGFPTLRHGRLRPDLSAPGHGLTAKWQDLEPYAVT